MGWERMRWGGCGFFKSVIRKTTKQISYILWKNITEKVGVRFRGLGKRCAGVGEVFLKGFITHSFKQLMTNLEKCHG